MPGVSFGEGVSGSILEAIIFRDTVPPQNGREGDLWCDLGSAPPIWKKCTDTTPYTWVSIEGSGSGAPVDATYLVLSANGTLTNERIFNPQDGLAFADGGAGGNYDLDVVYGSPLGLSNANADGAATSVARADHRHKRDVYVRVGGVDAGVRNALNFIAGDGISIAGVDDAGNDEIEVQVSANQQGRYYAVGNTTGQSSSSTYDLRTLSVQGAGNVSVGWSNGSFIISGAGGGGGGSVNFSAGTTSQNLTNVVFSDSNGISFGLNGSTITASHNGITQQSTQPVAVSGSNGSFAFSTLTMGNLNGLSFYTSNGSIVGSYTVPTQSVQPVAVSGSNGSFAFSTLTLGSSNGMHFYSTNGSIVGSYTVPSQTNQTLGYYAVGNTTQNSSTTLDARTISLGGRGNITVGYSNGTVQISGSQSVQPVAVSGSNGSFNFSTVTFGNLNGMSFYTSNGSVVGSYTVPTQSNQTLGLYAVGNTTGQSSSSTFDARSLSFQGAGVASVGYSNGSVIISVPAGGGGGFSGGMSTEGNTAGTTGLVSNRMVFVGSGPISLSQSVNGASATLSIIGPATSSISATGLVSVSVNGSTISIGAGPLSWYALGNTTQNSSSVIDGRSISLNGLGGVTVGFSNGSIQISGAAGGGGGGITHSGFWRDHYNAAEHLAGQQGQGTFFVQPMEVPHAFQFDNVMMPVTLTNASNSSGSFTVSFWVGIYTRNNSTLSLLMSTSTSRGITFSGTAGSYSLFGGKRLFPIGWTTTVSESDYWIGIGSRTTTGGAAGMTLSQYLASQSNLALSGLFGVASNATHGGPFGQGFYSATTSAVPGSIAFTQIQASGSLNQRPPLIFFQSQTF